MTKPETTATTRKSDRRASTRPFQCLVIADVAPELDGGRYPVKRTAGDSVMVGAARYGWRGSRNYVRLDPAQQAEHVFLMER
ncbi:MAG: maltotransferase domain-containing protein [bacterium]